MSARARSPLGQLVSSLARQVERFEARLKGPDRLWTFHLPLGARWDRLDAQWYRGTYYFSSTRLESFSLDTKTGEVTPDAEPERLAAHCRSLIPALSKCLRAVRADPLAHHRRLLRTVPPGLRQGLISRRFVRELLPDYMRYDLELGARDLKRSIELANSHWEESRPKLTPAGYFEYCRIAYLANRTKLRGGVGRGLTGKDLYRKFADGRDGGLLSLPEKAEQAFADWLASGRSAGCHPWEIYRGGNSTHIDLSVGREPASSRWTVRLTAFSSTRLAETCRIALALRRRGLPFELSHRESYLRRLLADDWVGVIPEADSIAYAWQSFPEELGVSDCVHFSWFRDGRDGRPLRPLRETRGAVSWLPFPPLFPKS